MLDSTEEVERRLIAAAPGALPLIEQLEAELPSRRRGHARAPDLRLRRRLSPEPLQGALARQRPLNGGYSTGRPSRLMR